MFKVNLTEKTNVGSIYFACYLILFVFIYFCRNNKLINKFVYLSILSEFSFSLYNYLYMLWK